jgi:hypothetical protein
MPGPGNTWTIQMTLHDNIMVTGLEKSSLAWGADPNKPNDCARVTTMARTAG